MNLLKKRQPFHLDNIWTEGYYGDIDKFSDIEQDDKEGWRIFTENDGSLILMKGVDGESYKVTYTDQYEVSIEDNGSKDVVEKTDTRKASRRMGATLIYKKDLMHFVGNFLLTDDKIPTKDDDKDSKNLGKGEFGEVFLGKYRDPIASYCPVYYNKFNRETRHACGPEAVSHAQVALSQNKLTFVQTLRARHRRQELARNPDEE
ncbi:hypothetical protein ACTXT7_005687 [Hymenolepis weldensis]